MLSQDEKQIRNLGALTSRELDSGFGLGIKLNLVCFYHGNP